MVYVRVNNDTLINDDPIDFEFDGVKEDDEWTLKIDRSSGEPKYSIKL